MTSFPKGMNEHYGRNVDEMPGLLKAKEVPISVARFMRARLQDGTEFPDLWNNYADTSDLVVYPKGDNRNVYVLLAVDNKGQITPNGRKALELIKAGNLAPNYGAVVERLKDMGSKGLIKVPRSEITTATAFSKAQVLNERLWWILARHPENVPAEFAEDKNLLTEYSGEVASRTKQNKNMALYLGTPQSDKTTLKAWCVDRLGDRSGADGGNYLGNSDGRLVGLAPEALIAKNPAVPGVITYSSAQVQKALEDMGLPRLTKSLLDKLNTK